MSGGTGGSGGGGAGGGYGSSFGKPGTVNTGGGGGGGMIDQCGCGNISPGGTGGSSVVIIAYPSSYANITTISGGLTYSGPTTIGSNKVYTFTAGTGTVTF